MAMFDLRGKGAVVTGGGRGLGRGIARSLARSGADVVIAGRSIGPLQRTAGELKEFGGKVVALPTDITSRADLDRLVDTACQELAGLDIWVNNAGSASPADVGKLIELTEEGWDNVVDLNLKWTFFAAQAAARVMWDTGGGAIINISSRSGSQPCPNTGNYGAAKAGVESFTATAAVEWGHKNIRVNAVAPGVVPTEEVLERGDALGGNTRRLARQVATVPLRRLGTPDDVGALVVFLASDEAAWISGETVQLTGGSRITAGYLSYMYHVTEELEAAAAAGAADAAGGG
jgi:NAD(P)-dependent dehydrogenase (short-subunit alcohol dehydrogenase family)